MIDIEKLKQTALASINHDGSNYYSHTYDHTSASNPEAVLELITRLEAAENELERERIRLAACGVVAMADTPDSALEARKMHPDYYSASCGDVERRVDECISLRAKLEAAEQDAARYRWLRTNPDWETYELGTPIVFVTCNEEAVPAQGDELDIAVDAAMRESK